MVLNMGAFYEGQQANDQKRRAQRKENAALYAEFVRMNPDSSVKQREEYVNTLGADSKFVRAALPTRDVMQSNVDRRKRAVASAAKERELKTLRDRLSFMDDATNIYSSTYLSTGDEAKAKESLSIFSDYLDENMMGAVSVAGKTAAQAKFDQTFAPTYEAWLMSGARGDTEAWRSLGPNEFLTKHLNNANAYKLNEGGKQFFEAQSEVRDLGASDDPAAQTEFRSSMKDRFFHLTEDHVKKLEEGLKKAEEQRAERATEKVNAAASSIVETILDKVSGENADPNFKKSETAIRDTIRAEFAQDVDLAKIKDIDAHVEKVMAAVTEAQDAVVKSMDDAEQKAALEAEVLDQANRYTPQYINQTTMFQDNQELNKQSMASLSKLDTLVDVEGMKPEAAKAAQEKFKTEISDKIIQSAEDFDVNISDPTVYQNILKSYAAKSDMQEYDELYFLKAVHEQLSFGQSNEAISYKSTLRSMGLTSLEQLGDGSLGLEAGTKRMEWKQSFEQTRMDRIATLTDLYDTDRTTLTDVNKGVTADTKEVSDLMDNLNVGSALREPQKLTAPIASKRDLNNIRQMQGQYGEDILQMADKLDEIDQSILSANAYLKLPIFANDPSLEAERTAIEESVKRMKEHRIALVSQLDRFEDIRSNILEAPIEALKVSPINKTPSQIELTAMALAETLRMSSDPSDYEKNIVKMVDDLAADDQREIGSKRDSSLKDRQKIRDDKEALVKATLFALEGLY